MPDKSIITVHTINGELRDQMHKDLDNALTPELVKVFNKYIENGLDPAETLISFKISTSEILNKFEQKKLYLNSVVERLK